MLTTAAILSQAKEAQKTLSVADTETKNRALRAMADALTGQCSEILAANAKSGNTRPAIDALIAATAKVDNLILVTRNVRDMDGMGVKLLNPFAQ